MKFLIEGIGSIGQRHYRNLMALGHEVAILRSSKTVRPFIQDFFDAEKKLGREVRIFYDLDEAVAEFSPEALIVANPNHLHPESALRGAKKGLHLFIEKPLGDISGKIAELTKIVAEKKLIAMVGYNFRFHPLLMQVKEMVSNGALGEIYSAAVEVGENIIDWHPWEDYLDTYAPYQKSGGGSLLCFSHDIDYLTWIIGVPDTVFAAGGKITSLKGDAEDLVQSLWSYKDGKTATLHVDYWQRPKVRTLKIVGSKKTVSWDYYQENLVIWDHATGEKVEEKITKGFERNSMFISEIQEFIQTIAEKRAPNIPLHEAEKVLELCDKMKENLNLK